MKHEVGDDDDETGDERSGGRPQNSTPPGAIHNAGRPQYFLQNALYACGSQPNRVRSEEESFVYRPVEPLGKGPANAPANEPEPDDTKEPLRRGLRPRTKPKQYNLSDESESDGEWAPKRGKGGGVRKRSRLKSEGGASVGLNLSSSGLSGRQERPLPPDLDDKQRRRILRNRASAERSRLKRLGQIAMLEQENGELRQQLAQTQQKSGTSSGTSAQSQEILNENSMLR